MNAQEKLQEYAEKYNNQEIYTHQQFLGKMMMEGVVISQMPRTIANLKREGKTIIITETVKTQKHEAVKSGTPEANLISTDVEETTEVLRVEL